MRTMSFIEVPFSRFVSLASAVSGLLCDILFRVLDTNYNVIRININSFALLLHFLMQFLTLPKATLWIHTFNTGSVTSQLINVGILLLHKVKRRFELLLKRTLDRTDEIRSRNLLEFREHLFSHLQTICREVYCFCCCIRYRYW